MKLKKIFLITGLVFTLCIFLGISASATEIVESGNCGENATYTLDSEGLLTISGTGAIKADAFRENTEIKSCIIEDGVTDIGMYAFYGAENLKNISMPMGMEYINQGAFQNCNSLKEIHIKSIENWCNVIFEEEYASSHCYSNPLHNGGRLYIDGGLIKNIILPVNVTNVSDYAFYGCSGIENITFLSDTVNIGKSAFYGCKTLTSVSFPTCTLEIGEESFSGCTALKDFEIIGSIKSMGKYAFYRSAIESIQIVGELTNIADYAFWQCHSLKKVILPDGIKDIGNYAFASSAISNINIPDSVEKIGKAAFQHTGYLKGITLPEGIEDISEYAFQYSAIKTISLPSTIRNIEDYAFDTTQHLENVYYIGTENEWNEIYIGANNTALTNANIAFEITSVEGLSLNKTNAEVSRQSTITLTAKTTPADASNQLMFWESSDETIATVDENGVVTGIAVGEATITARAADGNYTASCTVKVVDATIDVNGDGQLTTADSIYFLKYLLGMPGYTEYGGRTDMNGDGASDTNDAIYLLKHILWPDRYEIQ